MLMKTVDLSRTSKAEIWSNEDKYGRVWIHADIFQEGTKPQILRATVEQLEDVLRIWKDQHQAPEQEKSSNIIHERISGFDVTYLREPIKNERDTIGVVIRRTHPDGKATVLQTSIDRIETLVTEGRAAEQALLVEPDLRCSVIIRKSSLVENDNGSITAYWVRRRIGVEQADRDIKRDESLAYLERRRREPDPEANTIEIRPEEVINIGKGKTTTVREQVEINERVRDALGPHSIIAVWGSPYPPERGMPVVWEKGGETYAGEHLDFVARPESGSGLQEEQGTLHVLIRRNQLDRRPGHGEILDFSPDFDLMVAGKIKFEELQKLRDINLSQESFQMERN